MRAVWRSKESERTDGARASSRRCLAMHGSAGALGVPHEADRREAGVSGGWSSSGGGGKREGGVSNRPDARAAGRLRRRREFFLLQCGRRERARSCAEKTDQSLSTHASFHGARNAVQRPSTRLLEHQTVTHTILVQAQHAQQSKWRTASPQPARRPPMRAPPPPGPAPPSSRRGPPRYEMTGVACEEAASVRPCASRMRRWVVTSRGTAPSGLTRG